jgi:hypothetical protein
LVCSMRPVQPYESTMTFRHPPPRQLCRERERVTHGQGGDFFVSASPGSGLRQGLIGLCSAVMTGLTSKCLRNSYMAYTIEVMKRLCTAPRGAVA